MSFLDWFGDSSSDPTADYYNEEGIPQITVEGYGAVDPYNDAQANEMVYDDYGSYAPGESVSYAPEYTDWYNADYSNQGYNNAAEASDMVYDDYGSYAPGETAASAESAASGGYGLTGGYETADGVYDQYGNKVATWNPQTGGYTTSTGEPYRPANYTGSTAAGGAVVPRTTQQPSMQPRTGGVQQGGMQQGGMQQGGGQQGGGSNDLLNTLAGIAAVGGIGALLGSLFTHKATSNVQASPVSMPGATITPTQLNTPTTAPGQVMGTPAPQALPRPTGLGTLITPQQISLPGPVVPTR